MDKEDVVHIYNGILLSQKKKNQNEIMPSAATWISQKEKDKYHMTLLIRGI